MSLWRVDQAAEYLGIRPKTLYEWVRLGRVPYRKLGFNVRFDPEELQSWVSDQTAGTPTENVEPAGQGDLGTAVVEAARQLRRLESDLGTHLSFPQRRQIRDLVRRLERAAPPA